MDSGLLNDDQAHELSEIIEAALSRRLVGGQQLNIRINKGGGTMKLKELSRECKPGELVKWPQINGDEFIGIIKEWDNGTAIIDRDGKEYAVKG